MELRDIVPLDELSLPEQCALLRYSEALTRGRVPTPEEVEKIRDYFRRLKRFGLAMSQVDLVEDEPTSPGTPVALRRVK